MQTRRDISRRRAVGAMGAALATVALSGPVFALTGGAAAAFIARLIAKLQQVSRNGTVDAAMLTGVEGLLDSFSDVGVIARSSLGVAWRSASDDEKARYRKVFRRYLARKYSRVFLKYRISELVISATRKVTSGYMVSSFVRLDDGTTYGIDWQVISIAGRTVMLNLTVEGISMLATERKEIAALLDKNGNRIDRLIAALATYKGG